MGKRKVESGGESIGQWMPIEQVVPWAGNPRVHPKVSVQGVAASIKRFGFVQPICVWTSRMEIVAGHNRLKAMRSLLDENPGFIPKDGFGPGLVPVRFQEFDNEDEAHAYAVADNRTAELSEWDEKGLRSLVADFDARKVSLDGLGYDEAALRDLIAAAPPRSPAPPRPSLRDRFVVPPFSVLDARQGYWQDRKREWLSIGIRSELGRGDAVTWGISPSGGATRQPSGLARAFAQDLMAGEHVLGSGKRKANATPKGSRMPAATLGGDGKTVRGDGRGRAASASDEPSGSGTSVFDPVLCELAYRWFCPPGGSVLDPFAGGSVRGITASILGHEYTGIELRKEQVAENRIQAEDLGLGDPLPKWVEGSSASLASMLPNEAMFDLVFSCPPYGDLELYSHDPDDLSNMAHAEFIEAYRDIIKQAVARLNDDRFAVFVVGDFRDRAGFYRNFVSDTISAFGDAGACLYNEAILVTAVGSLPIRVGRQFDSGRKLGKTHQNVLVFFKGDPGKISGLFGPVVPSSSESSIPGALAETPVSGADISMPEMDVMSGFAPPVIDEHSGFLVVRDDMVLGGSKQRYFNELMKGDVAGVVYGTPVLGGAQVAIAASARLRGIHAHLFCAERAEKTERQKAAERLGCIIHGVKPGYLSVVSKRARTFADEHGFVLLDWGAPSAAQSVCDAASTISLPDDIEEVWCAVGSGTVLSGLLKAWGHLDLRFFGVMVGSRSAESGSLGSDPRVTLCAYDRKFEQMSRSVPPFPSCRHYDAKAWEVAVSNSVGRSIFWNVARHHGDRATDLMIDAMLSG